MAIILHYIFNRKEVTKMKRTVVFLLSLLLLAAVSMSGTGNIAFAGHGSQTPEAAVVLCSPSANGTFTATNISTTATTTPALTVPMDCALALVELKGVGLVIRDIHVLNTSPAISIVYTLVNGWY
jgi:ABC-type transport system substrate-binding protein